MLSERLAVACGRRLSFRTILAASLFAILACAPLDVRANTFSSDAHWPLASVRRDQAVYSAIGMIETGQPVPLRDGSQAKMRGTGFMVSACYALTAYHVIFGASDRAPAPARSAAFISLGQGQGGFLYSRLSAVAVRWGDFRHDERQDWVLLEVEGCPGADARVGWLAMASSLSGADRRGAVAGFDGSSPPDQMVSQAACALGPVTGRMTISHFCASRPGLSGSPIFVSAPGGGVEVVGIVSREVHATPLLITVLDGAFANLAVYVPDLLSASDTGRLVASDTASRTRFQLSAAMPAGVASQN